VQPQPTSSLSISPAQFAAAMTPFRLAPGARVAVAVSGGADSMALVLMLAGWARNLDIHVAALTVDHQLRPAAAVEAAQVGEWLDARHIQHTTLRWDEGPHARTLARSAQNAARAARYGLMTAWCAANGCTHLFVAHHADDQVETFLLRLSRGSGVDGLAAMAPSTLRDGIVVARPLLGFDKTQLVATCRELGQDWIEDPSNDSAASARVRFRQAQQILEREGLTRDRLLATVAHLQRAKAALDYAVSGLLDRAVWDEFGGARIAVAALLEAPEEIALRALARLLTAAGGQTYGPRFESLARLYARLTSEPWRDSSLHGCLVSRDGAQLLIAREPAHIDDEKILRACSAIIWDARFKLTLMSDNAPAIFSVGRLDPHQAGLPDSLRDGLAAIPSRFRETLPALRDAAGIAAVPHAGYIRADVAGLPGFHLGVACICGNCGGPHDI
jgi:tRNA(Ile)-lysidine synthase